MYQRSAHIHHDNHPENPFGLLRLQTESNNNRLLAYLMMQLSCYNYIAYEWQSVIANNKLVLAKIKDKYLTRSDLSSATDNVKCIYPKGYEIIDKYIKQLQKG